MPAGIALAPRPWGARGVLKFERGLSRVTVVVVEHAAETFTTTDISVRAADVVAGLKDFVVEPLVVSLAVIISNVSVPPSVSSRWYWVVFRPSNRESCLTLEHVENAFGRLITRWRSSGKSTLCRALARCGVNKTVANNSAR